MSAELSESLDPRQVADLMAGHLAKAMGVEECAISYWDRPARPPRLARLLPGRSGSTRWRRTSTTAGYPETLRVLESQVTVIIDAEDPTAAARGGRSSSSRPATGWSRCCRSSPRASRSASSSCSRSRSSRWDEDRLALGPDDGQRGRDGPRERAAVRGRPQARRPRPADRLLQPPIPARAPRRGGHPRPARRASR